MKWAVEIQKTSLEERNLTDLLEGLGFELVEGVEHPAIASPALDACSTASDAYNKAKAVSAAFSGPAKIDSEFQLGAVIDYSVAPPRRHNVLEAESGIIRMVAGTATLSVHPPDGLSPAELKRWRSEHEERQYQAKLERQRSLLEPAYFNSKAAKVIELLTVVEPAAETVYKIYELAEGHPSNRKALHRQFNISREQFDRFRDAVHNPAATGEWARHTFYDRPRTSNPMDKNEAEAFVRRVAIQWLHSLRQSKPSESEVSGGDAA